MKLKMEQKKWSISRIDLGEIPHMGPLLDLGAQWLSGRVLDSRPRGRGFKPHRRHCVVSFSKNINPSLVLVQPRKTRPFITERLLMGREESNRTNKIFWIYFVFLIPGPEATVKPVLSSHSIIEKKQRS